MPTYNIFCKKWARRRGTNIFDSYKDIGGERNKNEYELDGKGDTKMYGCSGETGFLHTAPTKPINCPNCGCPKGGSPAIVVEEQKETLHKIEWNVDWYDVLRVPKTASRAQIFNARNKLSKRFHPDKYNDKSAEEQRAARERINDITPKSILNVRFL